MAQGYNGWAPVSARLHCGEGNFADVIKASKLPKREIILGGSPLIRQAFSKKV